MNSLSWMIYLADVVGALGGLSLLMLVGGIVATAVTAGIYFTLSCNPPQPQRWDDAGDFEKRAATHGQSVAFVQRLLRKSMPLAIVSAVIFAAVPSSSTVYAIAASEMGEKALNTETGGKAVKALNAWLDKQIAGEPEGDSK